MLIYLYNIATKFFLLSGIDGPYAACRRCLTSWLIHVCRWNFTQQRLKLLACLSYEK